MINEELLPTDFQKAKISKKKKRRTPFRGRELCMMKATCNRCGSYTTVLHYIYKVMPDPGT